MDEMDKLAEQMFEAEDRGSDRVIASIERAAQRRAMGQTESRFVGEGMDGITLVKRADPKMNQFHVSIAAEAFAAALFARCGYDVSVQYGANQPEYDLIVVRGKEMLKVSVKRSQDGGWGLTQSYLKKGKADYHEAINRWQDKHEPRTVLCLVQFRGVPIMEMPRVYLATPAEIAAHMKGSAKGRGDTILEERKCYGPRAQAAGTTDEIPAAWQFSPETIERVMATA